MRVSVSASVCCIVTFVVRAVLHVSGQTKVSQFHAVYSGYQYVPRCDVSAAEEGRREGKRQEKQAQGKKQRKGGIDSNNSVSV